MDVSRIPARGRTLAVAAVALIALAGCAEEKATTAPTVEPEVSVTPSPTPASTPTTSPTPTATATPTTKPVATLKARLLPAASVPGLNAQWTWQNGRDRRGGTAPFGICAKADLTSIGATELLERTYFPPDDSDDSAAQQIAQFADAKSAAQAWSVLASWRSSCGDAISADISLNARAMTPVKVAAGQARWYLVSWEPSGEETGRFEALGMVRNGTRISVLRITNSGQDYNYPVGKEPMVGMLVAAAQRLG